MDRLHFEVGVAHRDEVRDGVGVQLALHLPAALLGALHPTDHGHLGQQQTDRGHVAQAWDRRSPSVQCSREPTKPDNFELNRVPVPERSEVDFGQLFGASPV